MEEEKHASKNTTLSYQRDLLKMADYLEENGITDCGKVTKTALNSYILFLEKEGKAVSTVSRALASTRSFFGWLFKEEKIRRDPADSMHAPKIEKKVPVILTVDEVTKLLEQPPGANLKLSDVNMSIGFITCRDEHKERMIPFGHAAKDALAKYLESARETFLKGTRSELLFTNYSGRAMSRQGFWKIIKYYGDRAGIEEDITPHTLRHSFAAHLLSNGADMRVVQTMMGHSDLASTQMYTAYAMDNAVREAYQGAHPRK